MLIPSIFGEDLFDDWMRFPGERPVRKEHYVNMGQELMKTDIREADGNYELEIDLPGFNKEDMKLHLKEGYLTIQAARTENRDEKDEKGKYIRRERYTGQCSRTFYVGKSIQQEDVHAKYENGILKVTFPKEETKREVEEKKFIAIEG